VSVFSYFITFYYIVTTTMLFQSYCLIKAIVTRRITTMRRRDIDEERQMATANPALIAELEDELEREVEEQESSLFLNGMFGGMLQMPLPIPEILGSLDRTKYKNLIVNSKKSMVDRGMNLDTLNESAGVFKQCPICWTDFKRHHMVTALVCNEKHIYHSECIEQWIRKGNNSCPLCRESIAQNV
jgi:hypothetical protein